MTQQIAFMDQAHRERFLSALRDLAGSKPAEMQDIRRLPFDSAAMLYLVTGNRYLAAKALPYVVNLCTFCWDRMMREQDFSSGIRVLAQLAVALFNGEGDLRIADLWDSLSNDNWDLAMRAIRLRRVGPRALVL